jgi:transcription initiation factor IIF auxiliary subunit
MTIEQIFERYQAGQTDLRNETNFLIQSEGIDKAYEFARTFDEMYGDKPYKIILAHIENFIEQQNSMKVNQKAVLESEQYKANLKRERAIKQAMEEEMAQNLQKNKSLVSNNLPTETKQPLFVEKGFELRGERPDFILNQDRTNQDNKKMLVYVVIAVIILGYLLSKK